LFRSRVYIDITIPGVQKPHWEPWDLASLSWESLNTRIKHQHVVISLKLTLFFTLSPKEFVCVAIV